MLLLLLLFWIFTLVGYALQKYVYFQNNVLGVLILMMISILSQVLLSNLYYLYIKKFNYTDYIKFDMYDLIFLIIFIESNRINFIK